MGFPNVEELETRIEGRHFLRVNSVAFSTDGKTLGSGSQDGTIKLWHVATGGNHSLSKAKSR